MEAKKPKLDVYFDFKFYQAFLKQKPEDNESEEYHKWLSFYLFLRKTTHFNFITVNKGRHENSTEFKMLLSTLNTDLNFRESFFKSLENTSAHDYFISPAFDFDTIANPFSLFLVEYTKDECMSLRESGLEFINSSLYSKFWSKLARLNASASMIVTGDYNAKERFNTWTILDRYRTPVTSILIFDNFLLNTKTINHNIKPMLKGLISNKSKKVEIVLLSQENDNFMKNNSIETLEADLLQFLNESFPQTAISIQLKTLKQDYSKQRIHDRGILTNYYFISSGHSFNYFTNERINHNQETVIHFNPIVDENYFNSTINTLHKLRRVLKDHFQLSDEELYKTSKLFYVW